MDDELITPRTPDADDAFLDRQFASLGHFAPRAGFEEHVMARVRVPAPLWIQRVEQWGRTFVETGRLRRWVRGFAATSVISITLAAVLIAANAGAVGAFVSTQFGAIVLGTWRAALGIMANVAYQFYALVGIGPLSGAVLLGVGLAAAALLSFNAWALYRLMQPAPTAGHGIHANH